MSIEDDITQNLPNIVETNETNHNFEDNNEYNNDHNNEHNNGLTSIFNTLFDKFKDPILVFLAATIIFIPQINDVIFNLTQSIPIISSPFGNILVKGLLLSTLYYVLKNNI